jgi:hypothetical protein
MLTWPWWRRVRKLKTAPLKGDIVAWKGAALGVLLFLYEPLKF